MGSYNRTRTVYHCCEVSGSSYCSVSSCHVECPLSPSLPLFSLPLSLLPSFPFPLLPLSSLPSSLLSSLSSSLYGVYNRRWQIVTVNFSRIFPRQCVASDYYQWIPQDTVCDSVSPSHCISPLLFHMFSYFSSSAFV